MDVHIKRFNVEMAVKTAGIEFGVYDPNGAHRGDLILSKTILEWCPGKTRAGNGKRLTWDEFITLMNARP